MTKRPHIVIFNPDQWRGDVLGHMGNPAAVTPNLDRLVRTDGVSFRHAYCQNPVCTPSRCSFMSGWYPHVRGHRTMFHMMRKGEPVLLRTLKENGYFVWWGGKPSILRGIHERQNLQGWTEDRWTELRATYYGMCARVDDQFGLLMEALRQAGLYDDTAVFFFADHGDFTGDYGLVEKTQNTFEDCLTRVPFLIKPPAWVPVQPRVSDAMVELVDFPATVEPLTGIVPGHTHFGRSLLPVLAGETDEHRDAVFCEGGRSHGETHCMELESTSNQNPQGLYWPRMEMQRSEGAEHTKAVMCRTKAFKYVRRLYEPDELYDLRADPAELHNRIDDANATRSSANALCSSSLADVLAQLKERLLTFYLETCDVVPHDTDQRG